MILTEAFALFCSHYIKSEQLSGKTYKNYLSSMRSFIRVVGDVQVEHIGMDYIMRWQLDMQARGNSNVTINTNFGKLRVLLQFLHDNGFKVLNFEKIKLLKAKQKPRVWLLPNEAQRMIEVAVSPRDKALVACLWATGTRASEILSINRSDVENNEIWVCGKGDKYREIRFDIKTKVLLDNYLATRKDKYPPVFITSQRSRMTVQRLEQIINEVAQNAGIVKRVTPHTFRHSYISDLIVQGASIRAVSDLAGHANVKTTLDIYSHITSDQKWNVHKKYHTVL